ncbi:MAG: twin-arginine translocase subunit TatC [Bacteroidales bacterium]|nr:twin-arginine translocase subunit TatC [Bacteroidales bacterium]
MEEVHSTKKHRKPDPEKEMSFWEHLDELRWRLVRATLAVVGMAIVAFANREFVFDTVLLGPLNKDFPTLRWLCSLGHTLGVEALCLDNSKLSLINITMSGQFMQHLYISMVTGFVLASPYVFYELWAFIKPALHENERRYSTRAITIVSLLFLLGTFFSYLLIVPLTINFLGTYQVSTQVANQVSLSSYVSTVVSVSLAVGVVFELPVLAWVLARLGIITPALMRKYRKVMIVIIFVLAAIITPPDVFSQVMVALPMLLLYEISILIAARAAGIHKKEA